MVVTAVTTVAATKEMLAHFAKNKSKSSMAGGQPVLSSPSYRVAKNDKQAADTTAKPIFVAKLTRAADDLQPTMTTPAIAIHSDVSLNRLLTPAEFRKSSAAPIVKSNPTAKRTIALIADPSEVDVILPMASY